MSNTKVESCCIYCIHFTMLLCGGISFYYNSLIWGSFLLAATLTIPEINLTIKTKYKAKE
jgi:hypothetical protein